MSDPVRRVLDAAMRCCERWGVEKVTVDDIAAEAGVSRATLYRMFPGGKDVLFDALRVQEIEDFFTELSGHLGDAESLEDLAVAAAVHATVALRTDEHLAAMLATEPGYMLSTLTVDGLPRILGAATMFLSPFVDPFLDRENGARFVELLARLVISYFLAPSEHIDLADPDQVRAFLRAVILPSFVSPQPV